VVPVTLLIIFLLLYLNFRSLTETLIVMLSLPFALVGGLWLMWWLGFNLSVAVAVGFIALAGVAAETGVVMLIYLNHAFDEVRARCEAEGREMTRRGLSDRVHFYLTVDTRAGRRAHRLLDGLRPYASMVTNLGPLDNQQVERWFDQTDALFLPTLLESFSLTYLEAAARRRPVVTSDRDFARHACGEAGYYVDPQDPRAICDRLRELIAHLATGTARIPSLPRDASVGTSWKDVAGRVLTVLQQAAACSGSDRSGTQELRHANV